MRWWGWWKTPDEPEPEVVADEKRKSTTAMLDGIMEQVKAEQARHEQEVQVASRRAVNASRKVVIRTGMHLAHPSLPEPDSDKA